MILDEYVEININSRTAKHYTELGYTYNYMGQPIRVRVSDLTSGSHALVNVKCDKCGQERKIEYREYLKSAQRYGEYNCNLCSIQKTRKTMLIKHGTSNPMSVPEFKEKAIKTTLQNYGYTSYLATPECRQQLQEFMQEYDGVDYPGQSSKIKNKIRQTNLERYGVEYVSQSSLIKSKIIQTNNERYGVDYTLQNINVRKKAKETVLKKYGVSHPMKNEAILSKSLQAKSDNNGVAISRQQKYLSILYSGLLNYLLGHYNLDIYLPKYELNIEYNGGGHDLQVKLKDMSQEEFDRKEIIRSKYIIAEGINQMTIISRKDKLPSDEILLRMLDETLNYLSTTNHHWVEFDIDHRTVRNALGLFPYDYGELRKIKKSDIVEMDTNTAPETA